VNIRAKHFRRSVEKVDFRLSAACARLAASVFIVDRQKLVSMPLHEIVKSPTYHRRWVDPREGETAISRDPLFQNARNHFLFRDT
jgi:hypothetical protein